jgi:hypothetical protein
MADINIPNEPMIAERISLVAIYRTLLQLQTNEGKVYDIVLNYKIGNKTISPPVFKDLNAIKDFINKNYPYMYLSGQDMICTWQPYMPVKFWVEKENNIQVQFKEALNTTKGKLYTMSEKKLKELYNYINKISGFIHFDDYVSPTTPTYVECIYIDDIIEDGGFLEAEKEYKKYAKL